MDKPIEQIINDTQRSYDVIAEEYTQHYINEFDHKPFDRQFMTEFARAVEGRGRVCDLGCGPGQVARYLYHYGLDVMGIDLSEQMLEKARHITPAVTFIQGDMRALQLEAQSLAGIVAFYSIIHIPREYIPQVLGELWRVLQPNGLLLLAFHLGDETRHVDEWWGESVSLDSTFFHTEEMRGYLEAANFIVDWLVERPPYSEVEYPSRRGYILARKAEQT